MSASLPPVTYRPATLADSRAVHAVFETALADLIRRLGMADPDEALTPDALWGINASLYAHLARTAEHFWLAEADGQVVGYARSIRRADVRELTEFFVRPGAPGPDFCRVSITRVSNFDELRVDAGADWTMTPQAYNLASGVGGVQAIRVDRLIVDGTLKISAVGTGFAGGVAQTSGTSFTGFGALNSNPANASGGGSSSSSGGAGGAGGAEGGSGAGLTPIGGTATNSCGDFNLDSVSIGQYHACGQTGDGRLYCWGSSSSYGLLGDGVANSRRLLPRSTNGTTYQTVASGYDHTCAINSANQLYCWGYNINGQVGDGTTTTRPTPTLIDGGNTYTKISTGKYTTCGITTSGQLKCWGYNTNGQVGDGTTTTRMSPVLIDGGTTYASISVGDQRICGITNQELLTALGYPPADIDALRAQCAIA